MKRELLAMAIAGALVLVAGDHLSARGPGGGGGGGGRGGGGGGGGGARPAPAPSAGRSPSPSAGARPAQPASRPAAQAPARPSTGTAAARPAGAAKAAPGGAAKAKAAPGGAGTAKAATGGARPGAAAGSRPNSSQVNNFLDVPKASGGGARPSGGAAGDFLQQGGARPGQSASGVAAARTGASVGAGAGRQGAAALGAAGAAGAAGARRQNVAQNGAGRVENRQELQQNRSDRVSEIHDQCNDTPVRDFWSENPVWGAFAITRPFRYAAWGGVGSWMGYGTTEPGYYNYGENVYYEDGAVYSGDQQVATAEEYAQQAQELAASAPETDASKMEWMPLGVFALTQDGEAAGEPPTLFLQLVLSKQGMISGTFSNKTTGESQTLEGMVDKESQRTAWGIEGKQRPIVETGLANLTKDSSPALIHFADGSTQQWLLVRLEDPSEKK